MVDSSNIADAAEQQPNRIRTLEQHAVRAATQPLAQALTAAQASALNRWIRDTTTGATPIGDALKQLIDYVRQLLRDAFAGKGQQAQRAAELAAFNAAQAGVQHASTLATAMRGQPTPPITAEPGVEAQAAAEAIPAAIEEEHTSALALLTAAGLTATGLAGLNAVFQRARRAVGRIARGVAVAVTSAAAHAARLVARALGPGVRILWVAEPGACPACAAYAGHHIRPGGLFPGGLSLDPQRTVFATPISGPPRHPWCRCGTIAWSPSWPLTGTPLPTLLRQRARTNRRP